MSTAADFFERCPVCRARIKDGVQCRRCGVDFSAVLDSAAEADRLAMQARIELEQGRLEEGFCNALRASRIHACPKTLKTLALAALGLRYFELALALWRRVGAEAEENSGKVVLNR